MNETTRSPVIIAAAPTGAHKSRNDYPSLPVQTRQIAEEASACMNAGAAMIHLHVRDAAGRHSLDADLYAEAAAAVRQRCGERLLIQVTSEQAGVYDTANQVSAIDAIDERFVSIALSEIIGEQSEGELSRAADLFDRLAGRDVTVQVILYTPEHLYTLRRLQADGVLPNRRMPLLFVLGRYHSEQRSTPEDLLPFLDAPVDNDPWMVCAFGPRELDCMRLAAARGGHLRVGFENNTVRPDGSPLTSTAESVQLARAALLEDGHAIADANDARQILLSGG